MKFKLLPIFAIIGIVLSANAQETFDQEKKAIEAMAGCFHVDYNFTEVESLQPDYKIDDRVYDVNKNKTVNEWIYPIHVSPTHVRLQHVLFSTDENGKIEAGEDGKPFYMRHQAEDWEYQPDYLYDFTSPAHWSPVALDAGSGKWVRKITNLDDGPRYHCAAAWDMSKKYPEWTCDNYAPIPGREFRDMKRKDYQGLKRSTRLIQYGNHWLERQNNIKVIHTPDVKKDIARESGKSWYLRVNQDECEGAKAWADERTAFWEVSRKVWMNVLDGEQDFVEMTPTGEGPRFYKMWGVENKYYKTIPADEAKAVNEMKTIIEAYRPQKN
jgi:hypothetical protein